MTKPNRKIIPIIIITIIAICLSIAGLFALETYGKHAAKKPTAGISTANAIPTVTTLAAKKRNAPSAPTNESAVLVPNHNNTQLADNNRASQKQSSAPQTSESMIAPHNKTRLADEPGQSGRVTSIIGAHNMTKLANDPGAPMKLPGIIGAPMTRLAQAANTRVSDIVVNKEVVFVPAYLYSRLAHMATDNVAIANTSTKPARGEIMVVPIYRMNTAQMVTRTKASNAPAAKEIVFVSTYTNQLLTQAIYPIIRSIPRDCHCGPTLCPCRDNGLLPDEGGWPFIT